MTAIDGGEPQDGLAPVIPLFGEADVPPVRGASSPAPRAQTWHASWIDEGGRSASGHPSGERPRTSARTTGPTFAPSPREDASSETDGSADRREAAEKTLLRKLRTRQLSASEARAAVREFDLEPGERDALIDGFLRLGYLDDAALAEQLVHAAVERKGQGRQAIGLALSRRGIARELADAALAALPDDDAERALEFARSKVRSVSGRDRETALRRLVGQLSRRGYPSSVSLAAARQALDEA